MFRINFLGKPYIAFRKACACACVCVRVFYYLAMYWVPINWLPGKFELLGVPA